MKNQIQELLSFYQLTAAEFSKIIGVNPSGLSHIIGGKRNYLSIDTIVKIKDKYPDINLDWLILGKGEMIKGGASIKSLFEDDTVLNSMESSTSKGPENLIYDNNRVVVNENSQEIEIPSSGKIKKIIVFNSDNTFEEFFSSSKK